MKSEIEQAEVEKSLLVKWIEHPDAASRLDQVLAVLNGGTIYPKDNIHSTRLTDWHETRTATNEVYGKPRISPLWQEFYRAQLNPSPDLLEKKRKLICFLAVYPELVDAVIALAPLRLPVYVVLEIVDWFPHVDRAPRLLKVRLIENIYASIERVTNPDGRERFRLVKEARARPTSVWKRRGKIMRSLIVLKGSYSGCVVMNPGVQPPSECCPHLNLNGLLQGCRSFEQWVAEVEAMPFLKPHFTYSVTMR